MCEIIAWSSLQSPSFRFCCTRVYYWDNRPRCLWTVAIRLYVTYEWVLCNIWMIESWPCSHRPETFCTPHMNKSYVACKLVICCIWMSEAWPYSHRPETFCTPHMNKSYVVYAWVICRICMSDSLPYSHHPETSCTPRSRTRRRRASVCVHVDESCHTYEWVVSYM